MKKIHVSDYQVTTNAAGDDSLGRSVVVVPQALSCLPNAYAYSKLRNEHWQDQMDVILARLKETGFPQHHYYS